MNKVHIIRCYTILKRVVSAISGDQYDLHQFDHNGCPPLFSTLEDAQVMIDDMEAVDRIFPNDGEWATKEYLIIQVDITTAV